MAADTEGMLFPLPDDQLPRVKIDQQTIAQWKAEAQDAINRVLMDRASWFYRFDEADPDYTRVYDKNGTRGCMRELSSNGEVEYLAQGVLHTTIEDVLYALSCETTHQQRVQFAQLYQPIGLDTAILQLYEGATREDPFNRMAMIWAAIHPEVASARDYLHFDVCCTAKDAFGSTVLVNYRKSYDLRPDQLIKDHGLDITRRNTYGITTYHADQSGHVITTALGHITAESKLAGWILKIIIPMLYKRTLNYYGLVEAKALQEIGFTPETLADRTSGHAPMCRVCRKSFGMTRHRNWCRGCGHAVCRKCNMKVALLKQGVQLGPRPPVVLARFCMRCLLHASEQRIKRDLEHKRALAIEPPPQVLWWESINLVDESSIDGLLDLHRDREDDEALKLSLDRRISDATLSSTEEGELSLTKKADELALVAASVAEHAALLRQMHQAQITSQRSQLVV